MIDGETAGPRRRTDVTILTSGVEIAGIGCAVCDVANQVAWHTKTVAVAANAQNTELDGTQFVKVEDTDRQRAVRRCDFGTASIR